MGSKREIRPVRKMKQVYLVFCEGETEEAYLNFLRHAYQSPIKIVSRIEGTNISQKLIDKRKKELRISQKDKIATFLMYDLDVIPINEKLKECKAISLCSSPCVELWFLLHIQVQTSQLSTNDCIKKLKATGKCWASYKKPEISQPQKKLLWENRLKGINNAKSLNDRKNPSSQVYKIVEVLENELRGI
jgi:hypothetical protein